VAPKLVIALAAVQAVVAAVNLSPLIDRYTVARLLNVNGEANLVAWLSSAVLLAIAGGAAVCAAADRDTGGPRRLWTGWAAVSAFFVVLSIDEAAALHELVGEKVHRFLDVDALPSLYTWVLVVAPVGLVAAVLMIRWFARAVGLGTPTGRLALTAVALWLMVPVLEALDPTLGGPMLLSVVEESLESLGEALMLAAVLLYLGTPGRLSALAVRVASRSSFAAGGVAAAGRLGPQAWAAAGSNSVRGASTQSRSRS
jgi:hypothetical protein